MHKHHPINIPELNKLFVATLFHHPLGHHKTIHVQVATPLERNVGKISVSTSPYYWQLPIINTFEA